MTIEQETAIRITNELQKQAGNYKKICFSGEYDYGRSHHYEFLVKEESGQSIMMIIIDEKIIGDESEFGLWNLWNFDSYCHTWILMDVANTIHELNKKDAE